MASYRKRVLAAAAARRDVGQPRRVRRRQRHDGYSDSGTTSGEATKGGTLNYYIRSADGAHWILSAPTSGRDITNWSRTVYRSLVTFPISEDAGRRPPPRCPTWPPTPAASTTAARPGSSPSRTA